MAATMTNKMMAIMSLRGRSGKVSFMKTHLYKLICDAVFSSFDTTTTKMPGQIFKICTREDGWQWQKKGKITSHVQCGPVFGLF
ncbi:hypothetical protein QQF64_007179 [Cirrhinus molitorella]|uniref:Uncharacterized protein n=1 Tax=Cirrhinus molitorella TaxID=172907 RepID=A0ABR3MD72_9TELE